ncbi:MAG: hypothetical protein JEZ11_25985 [Desulfobacterales bacterium]|nr:hypothetical protein [Desulfobacterales bacterium]
MKQKYVISFAPDGDRVSLREFAQVERNSYSLLCEEFFEVDAIKKAGRIGKEKLVDMLRTQNMYPPAAYSQAIAEAIMALLSKPAGGSTVLMFDDKETMAEKRQHQEIGAEMQAPDRNTASAADKLLEEI